MKTGTYNKTGKSQNDVNTLKGKENSMKTGIYKRQNGKVVELVNDNSNLQDNSPETVLLAEYQYLFNLIDKGSNIVNFVRTKEYKEGLQDVLQDVLANQLETKEYLDYKENIKGLLNKRLADRTKNSLRYEQTLDIFKNDYSDYVESQDYGVTKQYLNEMLLEIKNILTVKQYQIFREYHIKGLSIRDIATKLESTYYDIQSQLQSISNRIIGTDKIDGLCFEVIFDSRYVAYQSKGKKRQHKRKVLTDKEIIALSSKPYHVDLSEYKPIEDDKPEKFNYDKCQQIGTLEYFKVKANDFAYRDSTNTDEFILVSNQALQI